METKPLSQRPDAPQDLVALLERNHREQRPLLAGAQVYRGTRLPVQEGGLVSDTVMHAALTPQVATMYTHNHASGSVGYIGAYPLDRDATFHKDFGMEKSLKGQGEGRTVAQAEDLLRPHVAELAATKDEPTRARMKYAIEQLIKTELHETALPLRQMDKLVEPTQLYYYSGQANADTNREALAGMTPIHEHNSSLAKEAVFTSFRGKATEALLKIARDPALGDLQSKMGADGLAVGDKALDRIVAVSQKELGPELRQAYGDLPLKDLVKAVVEHPISRQQAKLQDLASMLKDAWGSDNPQHLSMGLTAAKMIADLPEKASYRDIGSAMGAAATKTAQAAREKDGHTAAPGAPPAPTKNGPASPGKPPDMGR